VRRLEQPPVGADQVEGATVVEADVVGAGGRRVEQAEPHELIGHLDVGVVGAVDEDVVSQLGPVQGPVRVQALVLDDDGDVVHAVAPRERQRAGLGVVEQEQPGDATVDVVLGPAVRVRVVPQGGGGLVDRPGRRPGAAPVDQLVRAAVGPGGQVHAVPVQRAGLG
jgi:hypothetical protein